MPSGAGLRQFYYHAPGVVRTLMAAAYSLRENRRKFTRYTEACFAEIQQTESWDTGRQQDLQAARLQEMLDHACRRVPFYKRLARDLDLRASRASLGRFPIVTKETFRGQGDAMRAAGFARSDVTMRHTSGTTGTGFVFPMDWPCLQREYAYSWAHKAWGGIRRGNRIATFAGHLVAAPNQTRPPFWVYSPVDHELFFSSQHLSPGNLPSYLERLRRFQPEALQGYPSALYLVALYVLEVGCTDLRPRAVFAGSETLLPYQRAAIAEAFRCPVLNWYGTSEMVGNIVECRAGAMHVRELHSVLEIVDDEGREVGPGETGRVVATGLGNRAFPMLRYAINDVVTLAPERIRPCGRGGRLVLDVVGRVEDIIVTPDGRHVGRLDHVFKDMVRVKEAQLVQRVPDRLEVRLVTRDGFGREDETRILDELELRLGSAVQIELRRVPAIERTATGKFRFAMSSVPVRFRGGRQATSATTGAEGSPPGSTQ